MYMSVNILLVQFIISEHFYTIRITHFVYFVHFSFSINESSVCILAEQKRAAPPDMEGQHTVLYHADFLYDACFYIMQTFVSPVSVFSITNRFSLHKGAGNQNLFFLSFLLLHLFKEQSGSCMPNLL